MSRYEVTIKVNVWSGDKAGALLQAQLLVEKLKRVEDNNACIAEIRTANIGDLTTGKKVF